MNQLFVIPGKVFLMGAGPGDPDLLTLKAARLLRSADVVLHDDLVTPAVLALASVRAQVQNVGKRCGTKKITQREIQERMIAYARAGRIVVRLKGGDPLIFGRAGEEMEALHDAGIDFEIVPGVTAAVAAAAAAQISLTDRQFASQVLFISNHGCEGKFSPNLHKQVCSDTTLVVYMPGSIKKEFLFELYDVGLDEHTPCLLVSCATRPEQRIHSTTLGKLQESPRLPAPSLLLIGGVAAIRRAVSRETIARTEVVAEHEFALDLAVEEDEVHGDFQPAGEART